MSGTISLLHGISSTLIYVDGEVVTTSGDMPEYVSPGDAEIGNLFIGAAGVASEGVVDLPFYGHIDALRFWNIVLTQAQIQTLLYDNIAPVDVSNLSTDPAPTDDDLASITLVSKPNTVIDGIQFDNLTASFGFNVESVLTSAEPTLDYPFFFKEDIHRLGHDFFHEDSRLNTEYNSSRTFGYNTASVGEIASSVFVPRVNWRNNNDNESWFTSSNWSGFGYPGQGITQDELDNGSFNDIYESKGALLSSEYNYTKYTVINKVQEGKKKPKVDEGVDGENAEVDHLIDIEAEVNSYTVDDSKKTTLRIHGNVADKIYNKTVKVKSGVVEVINGSVEVP